MTVKSISLPFAAFLILAWGYTSQIQSAASDKSALPDSLNDRTSDSTTTPWSTGSTGSISNAPWQVTMNLHTASTGNTSTCPQRMISGRSRSTREVISAIISTSGSDLSRAGGSPEIFSASGATSSTADQAL